MKGAFRNFAKKGGMVDGIKSFAVINGDCGGAGAWFQLVETNADGGGKGEKSRGC